MCNTHQSFVNEITSFDLKKKKKRKKREKKNASTSQSVSKRNVSSHSKGFFIFYNDRNIGAVS